MSNEPDAALLEPVARDALGLSISDHQAHVMNSLRVSGQVAGLFLNFGSPTPEVRRLAWRHDDAAES